MSSKSGKDSSGAGRNHSRSWSLSRRLTLHYALSAFVILNMSAAFVHWGLVNITERQSNKYLQDEINTIQLLSRADTDLKALARKLEVGYAARESMKSYGRILDQQGMVLLQTYGMDAKIPAKVFPPPSRPGNVRSIQWKNSREEVYLLRSVLLEQGKAQDGRVLQIALDVTYIEQIFSDFRNVLLLVVFIGTFVSLALAVLTVKRGLCPLTEIAQRTSSITAHNLDERVTLGHWPEEVKALAIALDEMLDRLQDSFVRLSSYVSNLAHELRTPINVLMGEAEVALTKSRTTNDYRRVIESNLEEYDRLSRIIDSLLFIARTDVQKPDLSREEIDICREVGEIIEYYQPVAEDKGINISCLNNATLYADRTLFRRAVSNLISNSLHYTEAGGSVSISTRQAPNRSIEVTVRDTGCGISKADLPNITDRFYRVDSTRHMNKEGTGLGLAIVKSIMDLHGGSIKVESEPGRGTSITLLFPRADITNLSS
ncbi:sensor histidine kinase, HAMP domain-containing [Geotalea daltonii FRC-32]|uniref:histidine kinase n=1 Tax=Geotalea daltonii (strain DSM 22248 / JCM 15807 / FRC-32) TaxID=316067 RepID=B9M456_GEODF|nr:heavy metal sensor histidine kinase [Geotalea daltonii]ACM21511.1 sensor histidine kinase, HAMP domain-containing [Geotalea daltonii FRC-32]